MSKFVGFDGLLSALSSAISASQTSLPIDSPAFICSELSVAGKYTTLRISDGSKFEFVRVTGCANGQPVVERGANGTSSSAFVAGSCVRFELTAAAVCDMIAQGGCNGEVAACTPVGQPTSSLPPAVVGKAWTGTVIFPDSILVSSLVLPSWASMSVSQGAAIITGTPTAGSAVISIAATGCNSSRSLFQVTIDPCQPVGVQA